MLNKLRSLCDVNFLIAICYDGHEHHEMAQRWLKTKQSAKSILICRAAHLSLLRLINNPAVMGRDVRTVRQAWRISDRLFDDDRFDFVAEPAGIDPVLRQFTSGAAAFTLKVWQDAYLAAFAIKADLSFVTFDAGFSRFKELSLNLLLT